MLQKRSFLPVAAGLIIIGLCSYYALYVLEMRTGRGQVKINHGLKLEDAYHRVVAVDTIPSRVISVAPNITEIIFALGEGKRLVGRTDYCDYPAEAASIESIGNRAEYGEDCVSQSGYRYCINPFSKGDLRQAGRFGDQGCDFKGGRKFRRALSFDLSSGPGVTFGPESY